MTRAECEAKITELIEEVRKVYFQVNPDGGHLNIAVHKEYISAFNAYWEEDKAFPIDIRKNCHVKSMDEVEATV